jgi:putative nucleotidyltransferase with HDIG domain
LETGTSNVPEEFLMSYPLGPQAETDYGSEFYRLTKQRGDSETLHVLERSTCVRNEDPFDSFAWFSHVEGRLAELDTSGKEAETYKAFIKSVSLLIEFRDPYTARHQKKVSELAGGIAREMGLPADMIEGIEMAGMVHDVGKMALPTAIVTKPGALTPLEFTTMKEHPQRGYAILERIDFPWPIPEIVLQHHERLDGSGYPRGLKGTQIRLEARVLAVADVVEAISSPRPYRSGLGIKTALKEIDKNHGLFFDAEVTRAALDFLQGKERLYG